MDLDKYYIPKTLDNPARFLFFTADECAVLFLPIFLGLMTGAMFLGIGAGVGGYSLYKKYKGANKGNVMTNLKYWYLPSSLFKFKFTASSHNRFYLG